MTKQEGNLDSVPLWSSSLVTLKLKANEVHVWTARLKSNSLVEQFRSILSKDENVRADRFYFQHDRDHFVLARGFLRIILSHYLDLLPSQVQFSYGPYGKPFLANDSNSQNLQFNLSHSGDLAMFAFASGIEIGVDVEQMRQDPVEDEVAERFFSDTEVRAFRSVPERERQIAFFNCWTRKEAYIKAKGAGLSLKLDQFSVSLIPGEQPVLLQTSFDPDPSRWRLHSFVPAPGYVGALAIPAVDCKVRSWQLPDLDIGAFQKPA
jgi:4'-phosphopantetheinyl transferase